MKYTSIMPIYAHDTEDQIEQHQRHCRRKACAELAEYIFADRIYTISTKEELIEIGRPLLFKEYRFSIEIDEPVEIIPSPEEL